jgi:hypothetical protein
VSRTPEEKDILTEEEIIKIGEQLFMGKGDVITEDEFIKALEWAVQARVDSTLLSLVLKGFVELTISPEGEILFSVSKGVKIPGITPGANLQEPSTGDTIGDIEAFLNMRRKNNDPNSH